MEGRIKTRERANIIPPIGKIKIGEVAGGVPKSLDYFKATGSYSELFHQTFGQKPDKIEVVFLSDSIKDVCFERLEIRKGSKLFAYGDGESFDVWVQEKEQYENFTLEKHPKLLDMIQQKSGGEWCSVLTLRFILPRLRGVFGGWQFSTRAEKTTIPQITSVFDIVQEQAGSIVNIPFDLIIEKVVSQKPGSKHSFPVVKLIPNISQGHLELVREAIESGNKLHGLLTEQNIESQSTPGKLLEHFSGELSNSDIGNPEFGGENGYSDS